MVISMYFYAIFIFCFFSFRISHQHSLHSNTTASFLTDIIKMLRWSAVSVIYDEGNHTTVANFIDTMLRLMEEARIRNTVYENHNSSLRNHLLQIHSLNFPHIHVLYLTSNRYEKVMSTMKTVNDLDFSSNKTTDFRSKSQWILLTYSDVIRTIPTLLKDMCHANIIMRSSGGCFDVRTLIKWKTYSEWAPVRHYFSEDDIFPNIKYKLNGRTLIIGTSSYQYIRKKMVNGTSVYYGWMIDVLNDIALALNFTYILQEPKDGKWGVKSENKTWDGLIGELERHEIDMLYAEYLITKERRKVMDFILPPLLTSSYGIIYRQLDDIEFSWTSFLRPFSITLHLVIILSLMLSSLLFLILDLKFRKSYLRQFQVIFFSLFGCLCLEGGILRPRKLYCRILYVSWWIFSVIITSIYTGQLTSSLLLTHDEKPFTNLKELAQQTTWKYGTLKDSAMEEMFKYSPVEEYEKIWNGIIEFNKTDPTVLTVNHLELFQKVLNDRFAFIDVFIDKYLERTKDCAVKIVENVIRNQFMSIAVGYGSSLKADLQQTMYKLSEANLLHYKRVTPEKFRQTCSASVGTKSKAISLGQLKGLFATLGIGFLLAAVGLILEHYLHYLHGC